MVNSSAENENVIHECAVRRLPPGHDVVHGSDSEELKDMFSNIFSGPRPGHPLYLSYLILASQFGSFVHPLAIMLSLPLSLMGVALGLLATRDTLNIMT